jgi:putative transcriptional regulator
MQSLQGQVLVAAARLLDPNFRRSVVLMVQHSEEGALGLILNRPTKARLKDVWGQLCDTPCESAALLHLGGPVEGPLMVVHQHPPLSDTEIVPGIYFTPESAKIQQLVAEAPSPMKFFVGYAGWGAGQLEGEMQEGSWLTTQATPEHVFSDDESLWEHVLRQIANASVFSALKIKHVPADPRLN